MRRMTEEEKNLWPWKIPLTRGAVAIVNKADFEALIEFKWRFEPRAGAVRGSRKVILMHRVICKPPNDKVVDHRNCDPLDNRRSNLRICTQAENSRNSSAIPLSKSGFRGVSQSHSSSRWEAHITINRQQTHLGCFATKEEAARTYDKAARKYHGEFATTNERLGLFTHAGGNR